MLARHCFGTGTVFVRRVDFRNSARLRVADRDAERTALRANSVAASAGSVECGRVAQHPFIVDLETAVKIIIGTAMALSSRLQNDDSKKGAISVLGVHLFGLIPGPR